MLIDWDKVVSDMGKAVLTCPHDRLVVEQIEVMTGRGLFGDITKTVTLYQCQDCPEEWIDED